MKIMYFPEEKYLTYNLNLQTEKLLQIKNFCMQYNYLNTTVSQYCCFIYNLLTFDINYYNKKFLPC